LLLCLSTQQGLLLVFLRRLPGPTYIKIHFDA
jgi:hypothetical protein